MKTQLLVLGVAVTLLALIPVGGWSQQVVLKANDIYYGKWINEGANVAQRTQKQVNFPGGYKNFLTISDIKPFEESTVQIAEKWIDSEGNVWYKIRATVTIGVDPLPPYKGYDYSGWKFQNLQRISKSGTVLETMWVHVPEFDPNLYPTKIDPTDTEHYVIFYRAKE